MLVVIRCSSSLCFLSSHISFFHTSAMSRSLLSSSTVRRLSQPQTCRLFSTSRPALRLSAFPGGEIVPRRPSTTASSTLPLKRSAPQSSTPRSIRQQNACFSSSSVRPAAKVTQNPRTGDDGQSLMIGISPRAVEVSLYRISLLLFCLRLLHSSMWLVL